MEWLSALGAIPSVVSPLVTETDTSGGTLPYLVAALVTALGGSFAIIHRLYRANQTDDKRDIADLKHQIAEQNAELVALRKENAEQKERLYLYSLLAPDIVTQVRIMLKTISPSPPTPSTDSTALPFPYERSRRSRPHRPRTGGRP